MNKLYNTELDVVNGLKDFFTNIDFNFSKPQIKILPHILTSIIKAENVTTADISITFIDNSFLTNNESIQKKLWRFFNNPRFNGLYFFNSSIKHIINNLKSIRHDKLIVTIDHMYVRNHYVVLMFSFKVGSQAIPLYFKCDKTKYNRHREIDELTKKCLFSEKVILSAIDDVINLLSPLNLKITFLADRWFFNFNLMKHINDKGHYFCIRAKVNSDARFLCYDKKEKREIYKKFTDLPIIKEHATYHSIVALSFRYRCNLSIARGKLSDDPWFILSNIEPKKALREYAHRFGTIETLFKNQKSNGFNLEKTKVKNLHAFENLYSLVCFACT